VYCVTDDKLPLLLEAVRYPLDAGCASLALPDWQGRGGDRSSDLNLFIIFYTRFFTVWKTSRTWWDTPIKNQNYVTNMLIFFIHILLRLMPRKKIELSIY